MTVRLAILLIVVWSGLSGCSEAKFIECVARDNTRRPCQ